MGVQVRNSGISSSEDYSSDESSDSSESSIERQRQSEMPNESSDSDSTDIEKPVKRSNVIAKNINSLKSMSGIEPVSNHEESNDSSEESSGEPSLSMSLLQKPSAIRSPEKNSHGILTPVKATSQNFAGVPTNTSDQRKGNAPQLSESECESESEPESNDLVDEREEKSSPPTRVPEKPAGENSDSSDSESALLNTTQGKSVALQQGYTKISTPAFNIPEDSCVWLLQIPRDVPASHLMGQYLPTELSGGEKIGLSPSPLLIQEQPSEQSKRSLSCMVSTGECTYKLQIVHPNGFWTLRRPPVGMPEQAAEHPWGVPIAPVPIEELLKTKTKKLPSTVILERHSNLKKHRLSGLPSPEETVPNLSPEKNKSKKKNKSKNETSLLMENTSQMENVKKSRKRKYSSQNEGDEAPKVKKSKKSLENSSLQSNYHSFQNSYTVPSFLSEQSGLGEITKEKKKKKKKDKSIDSFDSSLPRTVKQEVVEIESESMLDNLNNMGIQKKKRKKEKNKSCASNSDLSDLSGSKHLLEDITIKSERGLSDSVIHSDQVQEGVFKKRKSKGKETKQMKNFVSLISNQEDSVLKKKKKRQST